MNELRQFIDNVEKIINDAGEDVANYRELSQIFGKKSYKSKLENGIGFGCEELISKVYSFWKVEREVSYFTDISSVNLTGLISEKLQAEAAAIIAENASDSVRHYMWWGSDTEDEFAIIRNWLEVLKDIEGLSISATCDLERFRSLRSISKKKAELIRLWGIYFQSLHFCRSRVCNVSSKNEFIDIARKFTVDYPDISKVYGFSELLNTIASTKPTKNAQDNNLFKKQISYAARLVAGRVKTILSRTSYDKRKKAEVCATAHQQNAKRVADKHFGSEEERKTNRLKWLIDTSKNIEEKEFQSLLESMFKALLDPDFLIENNQELVNAIRIIYRAQNIPAGEPPWYPELLEEPYYANADIRKCAHFLFVLGKLGQGNLTGRWETESLQYLLKNQTREGFWSTSTFRLRPDNETTVAVIHALALWKPDGWEAAAQKAAEWLWSRQQPDGDWIFYSSCPRSIFLEAIDLAEGKLNYSLKLADRPLEAINGFAGYETKNLETDPLGFPFEKNSSIPFGFDEVPVNESFTFRSGQVLFAGKDLGIKTGAAQDILQKLVNNFTFVVPFKEFDSQSTEVEASVALRSNISYLRKKLKHLPVKIDNRRQSGYIMHN